MFEDAITGGREAVTSAPAGVVDASTVAAWTQVLATADLTLDDAARVDLLRALEVLKCAAEGAQAAVTVDFEDSQRARAAAAGVPSERRGRGVAEQVALARRESPHRGRRYLGLARALRGDLVCTGAALRAGHISEYRASLVATETSHLDVEARVIVDATLAGDPTRIEAMGDRETAQAARTLAAELDAEATCTRRRRAEAERRVTIRPAPDTMAWVTALLPVKEAVAVYAALAHAADAARAAGDPRTRGQVMADTLTARITGRPDTGESEHGGFEARSARTSTSVQLNLTMTDQTLLAGHDEPGWLDGYGPVPADLARELVKHSLDAGDRVWLRRLYTHPGTGELVTMDTRQRLFRHNLAKLIRLRDRTCRTPWCDAPIRELDHAEEAHTGGPTTAENGQGLCQGCNLAKQAPGWTSHPVPDTLGHQIQTTTPTGHTHHSRAPALTRPPYRQARPHVWTLTA